MAKQSIMTNDMQHCYLCRTPYNLQKHHCLRGAYRKKAEEDGLFVMLCVEHHVGATGVHNNESINMLFKREAQRAYMKEHTLEEFMKRYGKNYID